MTPMVGGHFMCHVDDADVFVVVWIKKFSWSPFFFLLCCYTIHGELANCVFVFQI